MRLTFMLTYVMFACIYSCTHNRHGNVQISIKMGSQYDTLYVSLDNRKIDTVIEVHGAITLSDSIFFSQKNNHLLFRNHINYGDSVLIIGYVTLPKYHSVVNIYRLVINRSTIIKRVVSNEPIVFFNDSLHYLITYSDLRNDNVNFDDDSFYRNISVTNIGKVDDREYKAFRIISNNNLTDPSYGDRDDVLGYYLYLDSLFIYSGHIR